MLGTRRVYGARHEGVEDDRLYGNLQRLEPITGNQVPHVSSSPRICGNHSRAR